MKTTPTLLFLAMLALGATIGLLVGLSRTPVVATVLPLLFTLIGGAGGFFVLRTDFTQNAARQSIDAYALSVIAFSVGTISGLFLGMWNKAQAEPWSLLADGEDALLPDNARNEDALDWLLLDAKLSLLGLGSTERARFLARVDPRPQAELDPAVADALGSASGALEAVLPDEGVVVNNQEWVTVLEAARALEKWMRDHPGRSLVHASEPIEGVRGSLEWLTDDDDDRAYIDLDPKVAKAVGALKVAFARIATIASTSRSPVAEVNRTVDTFITTYSELVKDLQPTGGSRSIASTFSVPLDSADV